MSDLFLELALREDAPLAGIAVEKAPSCSASGETEQEFLGARNA
jgi:hypothetical protein